MSANLTLRAVRPQPASLSGVHQATISMQVLGNCQFDCDKCRWVSRSPHSLYESCILLLSNPHSVGATRNSGRSRKQQQKPTQLQLGSDTQPHPLPVQVIVRSLLFPSHLSNPESVLVFCSAPHGWASTCSMHRPVRYAGNG